MLEVQIDATSRIPRVLVLGDCTGSAVDTLLAALTAACSARPRRVVVDLNDAREIDGEAMARILDFRGSEERTVVTIDVHGLSGTRLMNLMAAASDRAA